MKHTFLLLISLCCTLPALLFCAQKDPYPYQFTKAHVRIGNELCEGERAALQQRRIRVKAALEKLFGISVPEHAVPNISLCISGGGTPAISSLLGLLRGFEDLGLLDTVSYISTLSLTTFPIMAWINNKMDTKELSNHITASMVKGLGIPTPTETMLLSKSFFENARSGVNDLFGSLMANSGFSYLDDNRYKNVLSSHIPTLNTGAYPLPIYTAAQLNIDKNSTWYEFTPWEVGSGELGMYVPTWSFGRKFAQGTSINYTKEFPTNIMLSFFCGALTAPLQFTLDAITLQKSFNSKQKFSNYQDMVNKSIPKFLRPFALKLGAMRTSRPTVENFTFGLPNNPYSTKRKLYLGDVGAESDIPYPPLSEIRPERKSDLIIILDATFMSGMEKVEKYAHHYHHAFPPVPPKDPITPRGVQIFQNATDPNVPTIIYLPRPTNMQLWDNYKYNPEYAHHAKYLANFDMQKSPLIKLPLTHVRNWRADPEDSRAVAALTELLVHDQQKLILKTMKKVVARKL